MRRLRRASFALAVTAATAAYVTALVATAVAFVATVPCQWAALQIGGGDLCAVTPWRWAAMPWALAFGGMTAVVAVAAVAARAGTASWRKTRAVVRALEGSATKASPALLAAATAAGVPRVLEVDVPHPVALCYGMRAPEVLVSAALVRRLNEDELLGVLLHERAHVARRDPLRLAVLRCVAALGTAFPALRRLVRHSVLVAEWQADQAAVREVGIRAVASAMRVALTQPPLVDPGRVNAPGFCLAAERVQHLGRADPPPLDIGLRAAAVSAMTTAVAVYVVVVVIQALTGSVGVISVPMK